VSVCFERAARVGDGAVRVGTGALVRPWRAPSPRYQSVWQRADYRLTTSDRREGYNIRVNAPVPPKPSAENKHPDNLHQHHHAGYAAEATGLLLMAGLLLILILIRYWRYIPWGAR